MTKKTFSKKRKNCTRDGAQAKKLSIAFDSEYVLSNRKALSVQNRSFQVQQPIDIDEMAAIRNFKDDNGKR